LKASRSMLAMSRNVYRCVGTYELRSETLNMTRKWSAIPVITPNFREGKVASCDSLDTIKLNTIRK